MSSAAKASVLCAVLCCGCGDQANDNARGPEQAAPMSTSVEEVPEPIDVAAGNTDTPMAVSTGAEDPTGASQPLDDGPDATSPLEPIEPPPSDTGEVPMAIPPAEPEGGDSPVDVPTPPPTEASVTWHSHIASLVSAKCSGCHADGGIAPFPIQTYEQASLLGPSMKSVVDLKIMPPWGAHETEECEPRFPFKDDLRLSDEEIAALSTWVEAEMPLGDPATAAPIDEPPSLVLDNPALSLPLPEVTVTGPGDRFLCFSIDPGFTEDLWLTATQIVPGNAAIVHHVLTFADPESSSAALAGEQGYYDCFGGPQVDGAVLIGAWAPGGVPFRAPEGVAISLPTGSRIVVQVHYHPTGGGEDLDSGTRVDFAFADTEPLYDGQIILLGNFTGSGALGELMPGSGDPQSGPEFRIPAGASNHVETMRFQVPPIGVPEGIIWGVGTHMHYVGTDMRMSIERASPSETQPASECLVQTPDWDFDWQRGYLYDAPLSELPTAGPGDTLTFRCTYDNSLENAAVSEALVEQGLEEPRDVVLGEETLDEMCLGMFAVAYPR